MHYFLNELSPTLVSFDFTVTLCIKSNRCIDFSLQHKHNIRINLKENLRKKKAV